MESVSRERERAGKAEGGAERPGLHKHAPTTGRGRCRPQRHSPSRKERGGPALTGHAAAEPTARCQLGRVLPPAASQSRGAWDPAEAQASDSQPRLGPPPGSLMTRTSGVARSPSLAPRTGRRKSRPGCRKSRPRQPHFPADRSSARLNARTAGSHASPHAAGSALGVEYLPRRRKSRAGPALRRKSGLGLRSSPEVPSLSPRWLGLSRRGILKLLAAQVEM